MSEEKNNEELRPSKMRGVAFPKAKYGVILAVNHNEFRNYNATYLRSILIDKGKIYDLKNMLPLEEVDLKL